MAGVGQAGTEGGRAGSCPAEWQEPAGRPVLVLVRSQPGAGGSDHCAALQLTSSCCGGSGGRWWTLGGGRVGRGTLGWGGHARRGLGCPYGAMPLHGTRHIRCVAVAAPLAASRFCFPVPRCVPRILRGVCSGWWERLVVGGAREVQRHSGGEAKVVAQGVNCWLLPESFILGLQLSCNDGVRITAGPHGISPFPFIPIHETARIATCGLWCLAIFYT